MVLKSLGVAGDSDAGVQWSRTWTMLVAEIVDDLYLEHFGRLTRSGPRSATSDALEMARADRRQAVRPSCGRPIPQPESEAAVRLTFARDVVKAELEHRKRVRGILGYDDLLTRLAHALDGRRHPGRGSDVAGGGRW